MILHKSNDKIWRSRIDIFTLIQTVGAIDWKLLRICGPGEISIFQFLGFALKFRVWRPSTDPGFCSSFFNA